MENIALVHDWLTTYGGQEAIVNVLFGLWPNMPVYTIIYDEEGECKNIVEGHEVYTSFIQKLPLAKRKYRTYLPLMPMAIEQLDVTGYDVVLSTHHAVSKGVLTTADQLHISYVNTPIRYAWNLYHEYMRDGFQGKISAGLARLVLHYIRIWDQQTANRVDVFIGNSHNVANRIWRVYRRKAEVIYPPVEVDKFQPASKKDDYYVTFSRLVPYKRVDLVVEAFTKMGKPLVVLGDGPDADKIKAIAGSNVEFLGYQPNDVVVDVLGRAKALVFAANEDFGITPVEGQASGCPVIAYGRGGALETVIDRETGLFFNEQTPQSLIKAVEEFENIQKNFKIEKLRYNASRFSTDRFKQEYEDLVNSSYDKFLRGELRSSD